MKNMWFTPPSRSPQSVGLACAVVAWAMGLSPGVRAQTPAEIYRCGNAYTNQPAPGADCARLGATPVTVIEGTRVHANPAASPSPAPTEPSARVRVTPLTDAAANAKVDAPAQKERDLQARQILEAELVKAQAQQAEIARLWNNGEPIKQGDEFKNPAKYQERVAQLRMSLLRSEADLAGLRRELSRLGTGVAKP